jgi:hypothetical protein
VLVDSGGKLVGLWTQCQISSPLTINKVDN